MEKSETDVQLSDSA